MLVHLPRYRRALNSQAQVSNLFTSHLLLQAALSSELAPWKHCVYVLSNHPKGITNNVAIMQIGSRQRQDKSILPSLRTSHTHLLQHRPSSTLKSFLKVTDKLLSHYALLAAHHSDLCCIRAGTEEGNERIRKWQNRREKL